jgi:hypothetical protein
MHHRMLKDTLHLGAADGCESVWVLHDGLGWWTVGVR